MATGLVKALEERNSELAKEILLNKSAIDEAQRKVNSIDPDLLSAQEIFTPFKQYFSWLRALRNGNCVYRRKIFKYLLRIQKCLGAKPLGPEKRHFKLTKIY